MSQVIWVIQANMGQTNPALNDYVQGQDGAQAKASANATIIAASAISTLCSGTTLQFVRGDGSLATIPVLGTAAVKDTTFFATASQGALAASALQSFTETDPIASPILSAHVALTTTAHGGIDAAGSASAAQAFSIQRGNHTGTQIASTISDFSAASLLAVTWSTLTGKPTFSTVATSGSYTDLSSKPTLGTAAAQSTSAFATSAQGSLAVSALQANQTITVSGDATGSGATAIALTFATVATPGTYSGVTINAKGLVTSGTQLSASNAVARSVSTTNNSANGFQISSSRSSHAAYPVTITSTSTIGGPSSGTIVLEVCATNSATGSDWTTIDTFTNTQTITLAIVLQSVQAITQTLQGFVPSGWFSRIRSLTATGTITYSTTTTGQEVLL